MTLHIYSLLFLLAVGCSKQTALTPLSVMITNPVVNDTVLKNLNPRVLIGSHIDIAYDNAKYKDIIKEFSSCQALWYGGTGWLSEGKYDFERINRNVNWMKENGISSHAQMLFGHDDYTPKWIARGSWTGPQLDSFMRDLVYSIMDANDNKSKIDVWNVVNELFNDDGTYRTTKMVWNRMGWEADSSGLTGEDKINDRHPVFVRKAFTYCREKTNKKLELRDFNIETNELGHDGNDRRHKGFYQLLKHMLNTDIPIDAVGIQGHLSVGNISWMLGKGGLKETVQKFRALGLEVYITEIDAGIETRPWTEALAQQQKMDYYNYLKQAIEGGVTRINSWGIQDGLDKGWITNGHPLPCHQSLDRKPAYLGMKQALKEANK